MTGPFEQKDASRGLEGRRVGRYVVESLLGSGGMGTVYLASDPFLQRPVALKVLSPTMLGQETGRERFFREARAIARLSHPNVVRIYEAVDDPQLPFIAMEYVEGTDARALVVDRPELQRALEVMAQVFEGLAVAHESGVVHRDVKPANILLACDGTVKLIDFGLARVTGDDVDLTRGQVFGTATYMSPEQIMSPGGVDHLTDIYAAGALLFQLVTGSPPFSGGTVAETLMHIVNEPPPEVTSLVPGCPPDVARLVRRCLSKAREERPESAREVASELHRLAAQLSVPRARPEPPPLPAASPDDPSLVDLRPEPSPPEPTVRAPFAVPDGRGLRSPAAAVLLAAAAAAAILTVAALVIVSLRRPERPGLPPTPSAPLAERVRLLAVTPPSGTTRLTLGAGESFTFRIGVSGTATNPEWRLNDAPVAQGTEFTYAASRRGHRDLVSVSVNGGEAEGTILVWYVTVE